MLMRKNVQNNKNLASSKAWAVGLFAFVVFFLFLSFLLNRNKSHNDVNAHAQEGVWYQNMVLGNAKPENQFIVYMDYFCPYCGKLHRILNENKDFMRDYIDSRKINLEMRPVATLDYDENSNTFLGAESGFCAARQKKFFDYSDEIIKTIEEEFFEKGISRSDIKKLPYDFFETVAKKVNLDEKSFSQCLRNHEERERVKQNTKKASKLKVRGLPYISFKKYSAGGVPSGYEYIKRIIDSNLKSE